MGSWRARVASQKRVLRVRSVFCSLVFKETSCACALSIRALLVAVTLLVALALLVDLCSCSAPRSRFLTFALHSVLDTANFAIASSAVLHSPLYNNHAQHNTPLRPFPPRQCTARTLSTDIPMYSLALLM